MGRVRKMIGMGKSGRFVEGLGSGRRRMVGGKRQISLEREMVMMGMEMEVEMMAARRSGGGGGDGGGLRTAASR